jgi:F0F1-type ATP synthase membrane subunit b/b'
MAWDDLSKSLGTVIDERLSSPLVSSFVLSWSLWNYKVFFILFADMPLAARFEWMHAERFSGMHFLSNGIGLPLIFAILYLYALPIPAQEVYRIWRINQKKNDDIKAEYDNLKPIHPDQAREYRQKFRDFEDNEEKFNALIQTQRADLNKAKEEIAELKRDALDAAKIVAESKGVRDRLVDVSEQLAAEKEISKQRAQWLDDLIKAVDIRDGNVEGEVDIVVNAITASMAQSGVRNQDQLDAVRKFIKPIGEHRRNLVNVAARVDREIKLRKLQEYPVAPAPNLPPREDVVSPNPGGGFQTRVNDRLRPSNADT